MLTQSVMIVVFVLREKITLGSILLTAMRFPKLKDMEIVIVKCHRDDFFSKEKSETW